MITGLTKPISKTLVNWIGTCGEAASAPGQLPTDSMAESQDDMSTIDMEQCGHNRETDGITNALNPSYDILHRADNRTGLRRLMTMIRSPGLIRAYSLERTNTTTYSVSRHERLAVFLSLIDRGANGGICGDDLRKISLTERSINVQGIDNHQLQGLAIGTFGATVRTQRGYVILIFHQYAYHGRGKSIHSSLQLEDNGVSVNDRPASLNGAQSLVTEDGYAIPLDFKNGLAYLNLRPFTTDEFETLPHVIMTRDIVWAPSRYDSSPSSNDKWFQESVNPPPLHPEFDFFGEHIEANLTEALYPSLLSLLRRTGPTLGDFHVLDTLNDEHNLLQEEHASVNVGESTPTPPNHEAHQQYFLNQPTDVIRHTFGCTTQYYARISAHNRIRDTRSTQYPACNVHRRHENVATDTVFCDVTAWGGHTSAQVFVGRTSKYISIYGCSTDAEFVNTLNDEIRKRGAMDTIISDRAQAEVSNRVKSILRAYAIKDWQSEPHFQHQNYCERMYQEIKKFSNWVMNNSGAPLEAWLHIMEYVAFILNRCARRTLGWRTPYEALCGQTPDISILLHFEFWEQCLIKNYQDKGTGFPSKSNEILVRFIGYSLSVGHNVTFKVYNEATKSLLYRSCVKKIKGPLDINRKLDPPDTKTENDDDQPPMTDHIMFGSDVRGAQYTGFNPEDLIGRTFLMDPEADGTISRAKIVSLVEEFQGDVERDPEHIKFKCQVGSRYEELIEYNDMCNFIEDQIQNEDGTWNFRKILTHRRTKSKHEVLIDWESGERTWEPLPNIYAADKYLLAEYARDHNLLDLWESPRLKLKKLAANSKNLLRLINQAKLQSFRSTPVYQFGHEVPRNHREAMELDRKNGNNRWAESEKLETSQLSSYNVFKDLGHKSTVAAPATHKKISLHFVYAVKHDGRYKSRVVAGGHLTDTPLESVYSGVVSLRGVRLVVFLGELNGLKIWQTDVGNAYLEAETKEKVYVIAGPEFGAQEGHVFVIVKALYGLKSSGLRWHERFADVLRHMKFFPCPAEPDIWMRDAGEHYEYIAVYCDDLTIASKDPESITNTLKDVHKFKLKGTGALEFLLGCDYKRDDDGTMCMAPQKYIEKMIDTYVRLFGEKPRTKFQSPLEKNDRPELDESELLELPQIKIFQSLVGSCQWVIQLGRFDVAVHVMTLSSFRTAPRVGHLTRMKRIYGYLSKFKQASIRIRTDMPDFSDLEVMEQNWSNTPYAGAKEEQPSNLPPPKGKPVRLFTYADANLMHDALSGKAVTAILHFINKTPFDWFSRKQPTVNTATFGAEASAARTAIEQMRANKSTLQYLGVPICGPSILLGDNKTVVDSTSIANSRLHKRHLMLSYHYVREALATGEYVYSFVNGKYNPSDVLSKHWCHNDVYPLLRPILFMSGNVFDSPYSTWFHDNTKTQPGTKIGE